MTMSAEQLVDLSLTLYRAGRYRECVAACERALALNPNYAAAYNNICSAYNSLGEWDRAIAACNRALEIAPDFRLARGNLNWALSEKSRAAGARKP
jgi:tetratricopeptide (TPR) repeat protein